VGHDSCLPSSTHVIIVSRQCWFSFCCVFDNRFLDRLIIECFLGNLEKQRARARALTKKREMKSKLTGRRTTNATAVEKAAMVKTARSAMAYESRAARWVSGGNVATSVAEWRIRLISCGSSMSNSRIRAKRKETRGVLHRHQRHGYAFVVPR
jgi:hypothetical protein